MAIDKIVIGIIALILGIIIIFFNIISGLFFLLVGILLIIYSKSDEQIEQIKDKGGKNKK